MDLQLTIYSAPLIIGLLLLSCINTSKVNKPIVHKYLSIAGFVFYIICGAIWVLGGLGFLSEYISMPDNYYWIYFFSAITVVSTLRKDSSKLIVKSKH